MNLFETWAIDRQIFFKYKRKKIYNFKILFFYFTNRIQNGIVLLKTADNSTKIVKYVYNLYYIGYFFGIIF